MGDNIDDWISKFESLKASRRNGLQWNKMKESMNCKQIFLINFFFICGLTMIAD